MKFVIKKAKGKKFYYLLVGGNGEIMMQSEVLNTKQSCRKSIKSIKRSAIFAITDDQTVAEK